MSVWEWVQLKHLASEPIRNGVGEPAAFDNPEWPRYVRTTDIAGPRQLKSDTFVSLPPEVASKADLRRGDLVMSAAGTIGKSLLYESTAPACFAGYLVRFRPRPDVDVRFVSYWTESTSYWDQIQSGRVVSTIANFNASRYRNLKICVPPTTEQIAIANYLDTEVSRIDSLISKNHRLIELLQERWRAEVMDTVFNHDSLPWVAMRHIVDLLPGYAFPSSDFVDNGIKLLRGVNVAPGRLRWDSDVAYLAPENLLLSSEYELAKGDIVLGMDRPVVGSGLRIAHVSPSDLPCQLVQRVARIRGTKHTDTRYIRFMIDNDAFIAYLSPIVTGVSVPHISEDQILSFRVPLPSYEVQRELANQLTQRQMRLTTICDRLSTQIDLLTERRQALVTAVVSGERPMPAVAA